MAPQRRLNRPPTPQHQQEDGAPDGDVEADIDVVSAFVNRVAGAVSRPVSDIQALEVARISKAEEVLLRHSALGSAGECVCARFSRWRRDGHESASHANAS